MKIVKVFKIIKYLKKGLDVKTIDEVESACREFYGGLGIL